MYIKTCVKLPLSKRQKIGFQDQLPLNAGQKYCRMLQGGHSAILLSFIKQPFVIKIFILSIFEWPFYTCFTHVLHRFYRGFTQVLHMFNTYLHRFYTCFTEVLHMFYGGFTHVLPFLFFLLLSPSEIHTLR